MLTLYLLVWSRLQQAACKLLEMKLLFCRDSCEIEKMKMKGRGEG